MLLAVGFRWVWAKGKDFLEQRRPQLEQRRRLIAQRQQQLDRMGPGGQRDKLEDTQAAAQEKLEADEGSWQMQVAGASEQAAKALRVVSLANLIVFLYDGALPCPLRCLELQGLSQPTAACALRQVPQPPGPPAGGKACARSALLSPQHPV